MNFRRIEHKDIDNIKTIIDVSFGKNYLTKEHINSYINNPNNQGYCLTQDDILIGFISLKLISKDNLYDYFLTEKDKLFGFFNTLKTFAVIEQVVIAPSYRKKGYSTFLLNNALVQLSKQADCFICICWIKNEPNLMQKLLLKNDFKLIKEIPNYWKNDSLKKNYQCVICGEPPCKCKAEIYKLKTP